MSDNNTSSTSVSAAIHIGGTITEDKLAVLVAAIVQSRVGADWGAMFHSEDEITDYLRQEAEQGSALFLASFDAPAGGFKLIEEACRTLGLTYVRGTDCHPEGTGEVVLWWPGMAEPKRWVGTADEHEPCLPYRTLAALVDAGGDALARELALMKAALDRPDPLQIVG